MKIIYAEDNKSIWKAIKDKLINNWYDVDWFLDWEKTIEAFDLNKYDLAILDWMLPEFDWLSVIDHIRNSSNIPIIITTSKSQIEDKKEWFNMWADDYLVKPFELDELIIRIDNLIRRNKIFNKFIFENITIIIEQKKVLKDNNEVKLTHKEFLIIEYLINNLNIPVSRSDLMNYIWWWDWLFDNDDKLDVYISNIRKKTNKKIIKTIRDFWYKIENEI